jgi:Ran GTPase-activating protein 1
MVNAFGRILANLKCIRDLFHPRVAGTFSVMLVRIIITHPSLIFIIQALPQLQELEIINFGDCLVRSKGARDIAKAIKGSHKKLRVRVLSFTR